MRTVLIDYDSGNLHSAEKAFQRMAQEGNAGEICTAGTAGAVPVHYNTGRLAASPGSGAKAAGKRIAFPLCIENGGLRLFVPNNGADSFVSGSYGILEPKPEDSTEVFAEDIDLIIVPAVAFTKECGRLGQGGGYYDRLLKKTGAFTVGVGYDFQLCESLPVEEHDMPLDCVALPGALFKKG